MRNILWRFLSSAALFATGTGLSKYSACILRVYRYLPCFKVGGKSDIVRVEKGCKIKNRSAYFIASLYACSVHLVRYFDKFLKMNKTRPFMHSLKEQIEFIKNMLLPDYYFKSYNVSNAASLVTNNVRNVNGPCTL